VFGRKLRASQAARSYTQLSGWPRAHKRSARDWQTFGAGRQIVLMVAESEHVHKQLEKPIPQHETGRNAKRDTLRGRQRIFVIHDGASCRMCAGQAQHKETESLCPSFFCVSGLERRTKNPLGLMRRSSGQRLCTSRRAPDGCTNAANRIVVLLDQRAIKKSRCGDLRSHSKRSNTPQAIQRA
jgi:hypothetical protein